MMQEVGKRISDKYGGHPYGRGFRAKCPAHSGKSNNSLSITWYRAQWRIQCFAGCNFSDILEAVGLTLADLRGSSSISLLPTHFIQTEAGPACVAPETRHAVYSALLHLLPLHAQHRQALQRRGLSNQHIMCGQYRSLGAGRARVSRELVDRFGASICASIPGLYLKCVDGGTWWSIAGASGLLIPIRDLQGRVIAFKIRADDENGNGRYTTLSSRRHGGASPGSNLHISLHSPPTETVRLTEGELKADIATALSNVLSLGVPGVGEWRRALPVLKSLQSQRVLLAWDADWRSNRAVARTLGEVAIELRRSGYHVEMEFWPPKYGKGIDDVFASGHTPERRHWTAALAVQRRGTTRQITQVNHD